MKAIEDFHRYLIINTRTENIVESWGTEAGARWAVGVLNDQERQHGREEIYRIIDKETPHERFV